MSTPTCPRCRGSMEDGFILDKAHHNSAQVPEWVEGDPVKSFWTGLQTKGRRMLPITVFRCDGCGYLESYARADAAARKG